MKTNHFFILKKEKSISYEKPTINPKINSLRSSSKKDTSLKIKSPYPTIESGKKIQKRLNGFNVKLLQEGNLSPFDTNIKFNSGRWSKEEHNKFIKGLIEFGNDWKMVQKIIRTRSSSQSRSHAQKFFLKLKNSIKSAKISNEQNELYDYIFEKNKSILDLNDIKLTEEEKKQLLNIIVSSINLFDKNKKCNKIVILNNENYNNFSYNNYKDKFLTKSDNNSFHSDEDDEDLSQDENKKENENNEYKNIKFINNKRKRSSDENNNSENIKSNKDKKIFYVKKCIKYKYSEDFLINKEKNNSKIINNNSNANNKSKNKTITQKFNI
jgi:SHAQKYF class myb-like DNA-binding protein